MNPNYDPGTTRVTRALSAPAEAAWEALTIPDRLSGWLGDLAAPLQAGEVTRLEVGGGDFFTIEVRRVDPPRRLQYVARALGIGVTEAVEWCVTPAGPGCLVSVTATAARRSREAALALRADWLDLTQRLDDCLAGGRPARRPWPREVHASTELPVAAGTLWDRLCDAGVQERCFRLCGGLAGPRATLAPRDGADPPVVAVREVRADAADRALTFDLTHTDWLQATQCCLRLRARGAATLVAVSHVGWEGIHFDPAYQEGQRRRFAAVWFNALLGFTLELVRGWGLPTISPGELQARLGAPDWFVFDSNRVTLWERGHLPGALPVGQEELPPEVLPRDRGAALVFYCRDSL